MTALVKISGYRDFLPVFIGQSGHIRHIPVLLHFVNS